MFDRILAPLVSFLSPPKIEGYSTKCQRSRFVSCLTFLFFAIRQVEEDENWIQALFFIPFLSLPPSNSLILDRTSFENQLSTIPGHRVGSSRRFNSVGIEAKSLDAEGRVANVSRDD